jgi:phenylacetate-CoA ligase
MLGNNYWIGARHLISLRRNQWKKDDERKKIREKKLRAVINYAYRKTRFYKDIFDQNNIKPGEIKNVEDLKKLPIVTKAMVRRDPEAFLSCDYSPRNLQKSFTSGSTGIPLIIYHDIKSRVNASVLKQHAFIESGVRPSFVGLETGREQYKKSSKLRFYRRHSIPIGFSEEKHVALIKSLKPNYIYYHPTLMELLAIYASEHDINIKLKKYFSHGETLYDETRSLIQNVFECEIHDTYGSREFSRIAFECEAHEGLHIIDDSHVVEIIENDNPVNPGEKGEIIVSGLYNFAMPLLRYNLNDFGIFSPDECGCGRKWPILKSIEGRVDDYLISHEGRRISPRTMVYSITKILEGIKLYKVIQESVNKFEFIFVKGEDFNTNNLDKIRKSFKRLFGEETVVKFTEKNNIKGKKGEKIKKVSSKVKR